MAKEKPAAEETAAKGLDFKAADKRSAHAHIDGLDLSDTHKAKLKDAVTESEETPGHVIHVLGDLDDDGALDGDPIVAWTPREAAAA